MVHLLALQMPSPDINFTSIMPEIIVMLAGVLVMLLDAFVKPTQRWITVAFRSRDSSRRPSPAFRCGRHRTATACL
jgi:hypothetical protein